MKHVTAIYRSRDAAERARDAVIGAGIDADHVRIIPETAAGPTEADLDRLAGLGLSDEDLVAYREALQGGDAIVTAEADEEHAGLVEAALRDADEGVDAEELRARHAEGQAIAPGGKPLAAVAGTSTIGAADDGRQTYRDPMEPREG